MNCQRFQTRLYEYVEGTLSAGTQAAADKHLAQCSVCRQAVRQEQQLAQSLSDRLRQDAEPIVLRPDVRLRILTALEDKFTSPTAGESIVNWWNRYARPLAIAASLLLIVTFLLINYFSGARVRGTKTARSDGRDNPFAVSVQLSYCAPIYKFRHEGNLVVDTLSCETVVASGTFGSGGQTPSQMKPERKVPL